MNTLCFNQNEMQGLSAIAFVCFVVASAADSSPSDALADTIGRILQCLERQDQGQADAEEAKDSSQRLEAAFKCAMEEEEQHKDRRKR